MAWSGDGSLRGYQLELTTAGRAAAVAVAVDCVLDDVRSHLAGRRAKGLLAQLNVCNVAQHVPQSLRGELKVCALGAGGRSAGAGGGAGELGVGAVGGRAVASAGGVGWGELGAAVVWHSWRIGCGAVG